MPEPVLTPREREVVSLLVKGWDNHRIGYAMEPRCAPATVKFHLRHIFGKLAVDNRVSVAVWAVRNGVA